MPDFEEVYKAYFSDVYCYALSLCHNEHQAEEITQETFFKALKSIEGFRGECKVYVWLCQIARNTYFTFLKKQKRSVSEDEQPETSSDTDIEADILTGEAAFAVQKALHVLTEPYKEVLMLRIFGELSFLRIAELFGKTESWARVTYHRGKMKLQEAMQNEHIM